MPNLAPQSCGPHDVRRADPTALERHRLSQIIDAFADAVLVLDATGTIVHANNAARQTLLDHRLSLTSIFNLARFQSSGRRLRCLVGAVTCCEGVTVLKTSDGVRHVCHATKLPPDIAGPGGDTPLQLFVIRATGQANTATKIAQSLFGLTNRERDVLFSLVEVGGIPDTAAALNISLGTTRSHVKALFAKTGTSRQSDLVRLVSEVASPFGTR